MVIENYLDIHISIICMLLLAYKSCLSVNLNHQYSVLLDCSGPHRKVLLGKFMVYIRKKRLLLPYDVTNHESNAETYMYVLIVIQLSPI